MGSLFFFYPINCLYYVIKIPLVLNHKNYSINFSYSVLLLKLTLPPNGDFSLMLPSWEFSLLLFWVGFILGSTSFCLLVYSLVLQEIF